ncbi:hypothetical protein [Streptomyces sp. CB09001]|nr:hypothetical protein [Streptomyces sp. CB09001]
MTTPPPAGKATALPVTAAALPVTVAVRAPRRTHTASAPDGQGGTGR